VIFRPLNSQSNARRVVFITDTNTSLIELCTEDGGTQRFSPLNNADDALLKIRKCAIYSLVKPKQLIMLGGCNQWKVVKYHGRVQRLIYRDTVSVYPWSTFGPSPSDLLPLFDSLRELGVNPASLSTMARNSWLRLLRSPVWTKEWGIERVGRKAFIGGRKEALNAPANYEGAHYLDLPAAYLSAMGDPLPLHIRETRDAVWCDEGITEAIVEIPQSSWNPLPIRLGSGKRNADFQVYGWGRTRGIFVISELRNAVENHGIRAELIRVWRGAKFKPIFEDWLPWALELRQLSGTAGLAAKMMTTRLWSLFAINQSRHGREVLSFLDPAGREKVYTPIPIQHSRAGGDATTFLAAIIASRVRVRLLQELIPNGAVYVDTDGGITPREIEVSGWRETRIMDRVEIKGAQAFRWFCPECAETHLPWHYSIAGIPSDSPFCPALFEYARADQLWDTGPFAITLPAGEIEEVKGWAKTQQPEVAPLAEEAL
jgi:hypothetical protein